VTASRARQATRPQQDVIVVGGGRNGLVAATLSGGTDATSSCSSTLL